MRSGRPPEKRSNASLGRSEKRVRLPRRKSDETAATNANKRTVLAQDKFRSADRPTMPSSTKQKETTGGAAVGAGGGEENRILLHEIASGRRATFGTAIELRRADATGRIPSVPVK